MLVDSYYIHLNFQIDHWFTQPHIILKFKVALLDNKKSGAFYTKIYLFRHGNMHDSLYKLT